MESEGKIRLAKIEDELTHMWEAMEGTNKVRACLFNLVIYTNELKREAYFHSFVDTVIERFPCRIIFIKASPTAEGEHLISEVSMKTSGRGDSMIICDQILIETSRAHLDRVPFLVLPHLIPDLPVYLLWGQNPATDASILPHLERFATRVIFDGEFCDELHSFSKEMLQTPLDLSKKVIDVNWARMRGWRDAIAEVFNSPAALYQLETSDLITITFNGLQSASCLRNEVQAYYLQGWLMAQMHWDFQSREYDTKETALYYVQGGKELCIRLLSTDDAALPPGALIAVEIHTADEHIFSIKRIKDSRAVRVEISTLDRCELPYSLPLSGQNREQALMRELLYEDVGTHYSAMLKKLASLSKE